MGIGNKIAQYKAWKSGVKHCTFNPDGPGVVRIHLIPPKFKLFGNSSYITILNGYYLIPLGYSWAVLLSSFMDEVNAFDGKGISEEDMKSIVGNTLKRVHRIYRAVDADSIRDDLSEMLDILFEIANGGKTDAYIEKMSIRQYSKSMYAPHRMDLMVSAMTDSDGRWNCNQKCEFCYAAGQHYSAMHELSTDEWKSAIDKLRAAGVPMITFTGGEPTMRDDIVELVDYSKWFVTRLNTNGINISQDMAQGLKGAGLDSIQITLYSSDEAIHNKLVGSEHFSDTVNGIKNAVSAGLDMSVNTPLCKLNKNYSETLVMLHSLGVRFITLSGLICTGGANLNHDDYDLTEDELYEIVKNAKSFCDENGMEMDFTSPGLIAKERLEKLNLNVPSCGAALSNMAIAPDGTVVPCQSWLDKNASLGNILTDSFSDIWNHKKCVSLRKMSDGEALSCPFRKSAEVM